MELEEFIDIALNKYIEQDIIRLDVSDTTKNRLKRDLRKIFKDEDLIHDIKEESIPRAVVEEVKTYIEYYAMNNFALTDFDLREKAFRHILELLNKGE